MPRIQSKEVLMDDGSGRQYHIHCKKGEVGKYVLLPGDPFRTDRIAKHFDDPHLVAHNREHKTWSGYLDGELVSVCSTGMGGPSTAICLEELIHCGAEVFIRVGTCGRICEESYDPALEGCVITGAIRDEGTTIHYIPIEFPAIADREVTNALVKAADGLGYKFVAGISQSKDSFYGEIDPDSAPDGDRLVQRWKAWQKAGVVSSEMEAAALFIIAQIRGVMAGGIMAYGGMNDRTIKTALKAIEYLIEADRNNK